MRPSRPACGCGFCADHPLRRLVDRLFSAVTMGGVSPDTPLLYATRHRCLGLQEHGAFKKDCLSLPVSKPQIATARLSHIRGSAMKKFDAETVATMRSALQEVCKNIPMRSTSARTLVASKILECASNGKHTRDLLVAAGRRAVIEHFGNFDSVRSSLAVARDDPSGRT
jgi:hypothetical protein